MNLLTEEAEMSLILTRPRATESHAMSRCEQPERGSTHHSTREAALCVGGTQGDDECGCEAKPERILVKE